MALRTDIKNVFKKHRYKTKK